MIVVTGTIKETLEGAPLEKAVVVVTPKMIRSTTGDMFGLPVTGETDRDGVLYAVDELTRERLFGDKTPGLAIAEFDDITILKITINHSTFAAPWYGELYAKRGETVDIRKASPLMAESDREDVGTFQQMLKEVIDARNAAEESEHAADDWASKSRDSANASERSAEISNRARDVARAHRDDANRERLASVGARQAAEAARDEAEASEDAARASESASAASQVAAAASAETARSFGGYAATNASNSAESATVASESAAAAAASAVTSKAEADRSRSEADRAMVAANSLVPGTPILTGTTAPVSNAGDTIGSLYLRFDAASKDVISLHYRDTDGWRTIPLRDGALKTATAAIKGGVKLGSLAEILSGVADTAVSAAGFKAMRSDYAEALYKATTINGVGAGATLGMPSAWTKINLGFTATRANAKAANTSGGEINVVVDSIVQVDASLGLASAAGTSWDIGISVGGAAPVRGNAGHAANWLTNQIHDRLFVPAGSKVGIMAKGTSTATINGDSTNVTVSVQPIV